LFVNFLFELASSCHRSLTTLTLYVNSVELSMAGNVLHISGNVLCVLHDSCVCVNMNIYVYVCARKSVHGNEWLSPEKIA